MGLEKRHIITYEDLKRYGRDTIELTYIQEGVYSADFSVWLIYLKSIDILIISFNFNNISISINLRELNVIMNTIFICFIKQFSSLDWWINFIENKFVWREENKFLWRK